ncbi:hypothetical protein B0I35DRAFT_443701 [Stachybotrys elegans]|uniref:Uncharacterized protein n=1 Tax=Stachybotrys elegans TaxID=80388 RepID=A0A8K0SHJ1_9HYPO|nr:hypothetical protein B0I35DRAFT_443701 [Stachybotrys elegans]
MGDYELPRSPADWTIAATELALKNQTIHTATLDMDSGSEIKLSQYLLLRVLWDEPKVASLLIDECKVNGGPVHKQMLNKAQLLLDQIASWKTYLEDSTSGSEGTFALVRYYQNLSMKPPKDKPDNSGVLNKVAFSPTSPAVARAQPPSSQPTTPPAQTSGVDDLPRELQGLFLGSPWSNVSTSYPIGGKKAINYTAIEDEQIVNTALLLFLNALTLHFPNEVKGEWTLRRHPLRMKSNSNPKVYEARVDGFLRLNNEEREPAAIVEVKPFLRERTDAISRDIRMQEAAQMAAWVSEFPPVMASTKANANNTHRRLLVSQDHEEIYLNVATFDNQYVSYVQGHITTTTSFLRIQQYGPFNVGKTKDMKYLGRLLLAVTLQGGLI